MRIDIMDAVIGVGAGSLDEVMERQDEQNGRTEPFKTWADWSRVGLAALGYLGQAFNFFPRYAQPLAQSEITLVTKSAAKAILSNTGISSHVSSARTGGSPSAPSGVGSRGRVGWRPKAIGG